MNPESTTGASGTVLKCRGCDKAYKIHPEKLPKGISSFPCRACGTLIPISFELNEVSGSAAPAGEVLIALEEEELGSLVQRILKGGGFQSSLAGSGNEALRALSHGSYDAMLLSVYLPDMAGYELLDRIRKDRGASIPSILLSSIHHAARYKRAPTSLYGADDYLERHHLPDLLIPKILRLLSSGGASNPPPDPGRLPPPSDDQVQARRDLEAVERESEVHKDPTMGQVRRMCRVIAGDIALYNEDVISSVRAENLLEAIAGDLSEGEALIMSRFPEIEDQASQLLRAEIVRLLNARGIEVS